MEGAMASVTDSIQRVINVLVLFNQVCRYSRAGWPPELTILRRRVASAHCRWLLIGRISAREDYVQGQ